MDATLREILLNLRSISSPNHTDLQHPLAKYTFRAVYPDTSVGGGGRFQTKELGTVFARDLSNVAVLSESFDPDSQPSNTDVIETEKEERPRREREDRTLEQMRFLPGDYLDIAVILPKGAAAPTGHGVGPGLQIKGAIAAAATANSLNGGLRGAPGADRWGPGTGRGGPAAGGHWRGGAPAPAGPSGRGGALGGVGAGRGGFGRERERDRDIPPPREPRVVRERGLREEKRERDERDDRSSRFEKERRARDLRDDRPREHRDYERPVRSTRRATPPRRGGGGQPARRRSYTRSISASRSRSRTLSPRRKRSRSRD